MDCSSYRLLPERVFIKEGIARVGETGQVMLSHEFIDPGIVSCRIIDPVIGNGPLQPFCPVGPVPGSALDKFDLAIQVELEKMVRGLNF
jgi:hypothetical protein